MVLVVGIGIAYYFHGRSNLPASEPAPVAQPPAAGSEPAIEHPLPASATAQSTPLPALNDSDSAMKEAISSLIGANAMQYVVPEDIVRHVVVTIDNLPRQKAPAAKRPTVAVPGAFMADRRDGGKGAKLSIRSAKTLKDIIKYECKIAGFGRVAF